MASSNTGTCFLCNEEVNHRSITKHIEKCLGNDASHQPSETECIFLIKVYCGKEFWLYIEINGSAKLEDLDYYLRGVWLECCGHMSQFKINGQRYSYDGGMNKIIHRTLKVNAEFDYVYDFVLDSGHVVEINNIQVITLGHKFNFNRVVSHEYFGDKIIDDLKNHKDFNSGMIVLDNYQFVRDSNMRVIKLKY